MKVVCKVCGVEFNVAPCVVKRGGGKYCSHECNGRASGFSRASKKDSISVNSVNSAVVLSDRELFLLKVRAARKRFGHFYKYDDCGTPIGEYDDEGNLTEF